MSVKNAYKKLSSLSATLLLAFFLSGISYAAPGDLDPTFGDDGKVTTEFNFANAVGVAVQVDGKIVVAGTDAAFSSSQFVLARYHSDGSLDTSFGNGGKVSTSVGQFNDASAVAIQADGRIVVAGSVCVFGPICDFAVVRYLPDGSLDASFDGDGKVIIDMGDHNFARDLAIQSDGKIVVVGGSGIQGSRNFAFAVARLNSDGSLDATFDGDGRAITILGTFSDFGASAVALQSDGKIVAAGQIGSGSTYSSTDFALVRYNPDGSLDPTFDSDGKVITDVSGSGENASDVAIQPDGKIIVVGSIGQIAVVRYNANGSLDASFDGDGIVITLVGNNSGASSVAIQSNGKIVITGGRNFLVIRYNPNGSLDTSFSGDGIATTSFGSEGFSSSGDVAIQPDGKIVAAGTYGQHGEFSVFAVARYIGGDTVVQNRKLFDFDGDGRSDVSVFRPSNATWYLNQSTAGFSATQFGAANDRIAPDDYDGDGRTDIAVFRDGTWYWLNSSNQNFNAVQFGLAGDFPVPADFTGDGRAELAVYRGGLWYSYDLSNNQVNTAQFGVATDKPVAGDYDGDGRADYAVYRDGTWYLLRSTEGFAAIEFGVSSDKLVPADYDGDGKTDLAVFRDGTWYLRQSTAGFGLLQFGTSSDLPAPADYDGDGRTDAAVFRNGTWYLQQSTNGFSVQQFGVVNDKPVPAAFLP